jgi:hypothetical protein
MKMSHCIAFKIETKKKKKRNRKKQPKIVAFSGTGSL